MSEIIIGHPPNIEKIRATFKLNGNEIFSWGNKIYNPANVYIDEALIAHEAVHEQQQTHDETAILAWWDRYLVDTDFRFSQELEAHKVEYKVFCKLRKDRNAQVRYLNQIAARLSSGIYGNIITQAQAIKEIKG